MAWKRPEVEKRPSKLPEREKVKGGVGKVKKLQPRERVEDGDERAVASAPKSRAATVNPGEIREKLGLSQEEWELFTDEMCVHDFMAGDRGREVKPKYNRLPPAAQGWLQKRWGYGEE